MKKIVEVAVSAIAVLGVTGFFLWQNHQRDLANRPSYEGNESAIARPLNQDNLQSKLCAVKRVSDGDTIAVDCSGQELKIRFCGIDAPEKAQPLGAESKAKLEALVNSDRGNVKVFPIEQDKYGRTVAEVEVFSGQKTDRGDRVNIFVNAEMVRSGMAYHYAQYSGNCPNKEAIVNAEDEARKEKIGVWDGGNYQKPWEYRRSKR